jgi:putative peptidoglycan lipid II flippase
VAGSWLIATAADVILTEFAPARLVVAALALGNTIGQVVVAVPLVLVVRRIRGRASVQGTAHAALAGLAAAAAAAAAGVAVGLALPASHKLVAAGVAVLAASAAVIVYGVVIYLLDDGDLRAGLARLRQGALSRFLTR